MPTRALLLKLSIFLVINSISAGCIVESGCSHSAGCCFSQQKTHQSGIGSRVHSMPAHVKSKSSYHHCCCHASDSQACNLSHLQSSNTIKLALSPPRVRTPIFISDQGVIELSTVIIACEPHFNSNFENWAYRISTIPTYVSTMSFMCWFIQFRKAHNAAMIQARHCSDI
jgi:hypothetical protein